MEKVIQKYPRQVITLGVYGKIPIDSLCEVYIDTEDGECIVIYQSKTSTSLGGWVYDGAACLAKYLETQMLPLTNTNPTPLRGKRVIELGAGTGVVGLMAGYYGAEAYVTDLEAMTPLLQYNVDKNANHIRGSVTVKPLKWGDNCDELKPAPDYLILANCIYYVSSFEPLLETMKELSGYETEILACYEIRTTEINSLINCWHEMIDKYFEIIHLPSDNLCEKYKQDFIKLVKMKKR